MSASFNLALDTHAPQVTWGIATGVEPGETFAQPYTLNEPAIQSATIRLVDGRVLTMTVGGSELTVDLPLDSYAGNAKISAVVRDDVWNQATVTRTVRLEGEILPPPLDVPSAMPVGGIPTDRLRGPARRLVERRSAARATSTTRISAQRRQRRTAVGTSTRRVDRRVVPAAPLPGPVPPPQTVRVQRRAVAHVGARVSHAVRAQVKGSAIATSIVTVRKGDDEAVLETLGIV